MMLKTITEARTHHSFPASLSPGLSRTMMLCDSCEAGACKAERTADRIVEMSDAFAAGAEEARDQLDRDDRPAHGYGELFGDGQPALLGSEQAQLFRRDAGKAHVAEGDRGDDAKHEQAAKDSDALHDACDGIGQETADDRVGRDQAGGKGDGDRKPSEELAARTWPNARICAAAQLTDPGSSTMTTSRSTPR